MEINCSINCTLYIERFPIVCFNNFFRIIYSQMECAILFSLDCILLLLFLGSWFFKGFSFQRKIETCKINVLNTFAQRKIQGWTSPFIHCWFPLECFENNFENEVRSFRSLCTSTHCTLLSSFDLNLFWIESRIWLVIWSLFS